MILSNNLKAGENAVQNFGYLAVYTRFINQRTEGPESRTDGETLIFWE